MPHIKRITAALTMLLLSTLLFSCSKNELEGKWVSDVAPDVSITFFDDGTMIIDSDGSELDGTYSLSDNTLVMKINTKSFSQSQTATVEISKKKLLLTNESGQTEQFSKKGF